MKTSFRAFISFDIEGISGVTSWQELKNDLSSLNMIKRIATDEVNASIRGVLCL
jgi:D-aminopeptidase